MMDMRSKRRPEVQGLGDIDANEVDQSTNDLAGRIKVEVGDDSTLVHIIEVTSKELNGLAKGFNRVGYKLTRLSRSNFQRTL